MDNLWIFDVPFIIIMNHYLWIVMGFHVPCHICAGSHVAMAALPGPGQALPSLASEAPEAEASSGASGIILANFEV